MITMSTKITQATAEDGNHKEQWPDNIQQPLDKFDLLSTAHEKETDDSDKVTNEQPCLSKEETRMKIDQSESHGTNASF